MKQFLKEHPELQRMAYIKLYEEGVNDFPEPEQSEEEEELDFFVWIDAIQHYTNNLLLELDKTIKISF